MSKQSMTKWTCDRCQAEVETTGTDAPTGWGVFGVVFNSVTANLPREHVCATCSVALKAVLEALRGSKPEDDPCPAFWTEPDVDACNLGVGHEGRHQTKYISWPQGTGRYDDEYQCQAFWGDPKIDRCLLPREHDKNHQSATGTSWSDDEFACGQINPERPESGPCKRTSDHVGRHESRYDLSWPATGSKTCKSTWDGKKCRKVDGHTGRHENADREWANTAEEKP